MLLILPTQILEALPDKRVSESAPKLEYVSGFIILSLWELILIRTHGGMAKRAPWLGPLLVGSVGVPMAHRHSS